MESLRASMVYSSDYGPKASASSLSFMPSTEPRTYSLTELCPQEFEETFHAFKGNAFGHANLLSQSLCLKPSMDSLVANMVPPLAHPFFGHASAHSCRHFQSCSITSLPTISGSPPPTPENPPHMHAPGRCSQATSPTLALEYLLPSSPEMSLPPSYTPSYTRSTLPLRPLASTAQ